MARKYMLVSDKTGTEIPDGDGATLRITYTDGRRQSLEADLTVQEAQELGTLVNARAVARRGRKRISA